MRKSLGLIVAVGLAFAPLGASAAQTTLTAAGRLDPLGNVGETARAAALGSAFVGVSDDASALLWNPAGLSGLTDVDLSIHHNTWLGQFLQETLVAGIPLKGAGGLGVAVHYAGFGSFEGRDANGFLTTGYSAHQIGAQAGYGRTLVGGLSGGLSVHDTQETLAGTATNFLGVDLGALLAVKGGWRFGASYSNLGVGSSSNALAASLQLGLSKSWRDKNGNGLLVTLSGTDQPQITNSIQGGLEGTYHSVLAIRVGYNHPFTATGYTGLQGLTAGAGLVLKSFRLDYAFIPYGELGNTHRISLGYGWGSAAPPKAAVTPSATPTPSAPAQPTLPAGQVQPQPVPDQTTGSTQPSRTITMEFEIPTEEGVARAKALVKAERWVEAVQTLRNILLKNSRDPEAWRELGEVYFRLNKKPYAVQCFDNYLKLKPEDKALSDWLAKYRVP